MTLRLVHPQDGGQATRPPKGCRSAALLLTPEEVRHFRAALRNVACAYGGMPVLAEVVGVPVNSLRHALNKRGRPSAIMVLRVARAAGMAFEAMIGPALNEAGRCQACGARVGDRSERRVS